MCKPCEKEKKSKNHSLHTHCAGKGVYLCLIVGWGVGRKGHNQAAIVLHAHFILSPLLLEASAMGEDSGRQRQISDLVAAYPMSVPDSVYRRRSTIRRTLVSTGHCIENTRDMTRGACDRRLQKGTSEGALDHDGALDLALNSRTGSTGR
eukprot:1176126-Rhodomonas_salina.2